MRNYLLSIDILLSEKLFIRKKVFKSRILTLEKFLNTHASFKTSIYNKFSVIADKF